MFAPPLLIRFGAVAKQVTSHIVGYGVLPCFRTFCRFLFDMHPKTRKTVGRTPKIGGNHSTAHRIML